MKIVAVIAGLILVLLLIAGGGWLYLRAPDIPVADLQAQYGRANSRHADLSGGVRLHYLESGPADAPVLFLVHGFGDNGFSWDGWTQVLSANHRVIALDLPGHGLTEAPADFPAAPDRYADLVEELAVKLGLGRIAIAGNSLGGGVAWQLAVRHPDRLSRLILVDAAGWPTVSLQDPPLAFKLMRYQWGRDLIASIDNKPLIREGLKRDVVDQSVLTEAFIQRWADLQRLPGHRPILMSLNPGSLAVSNELLAGIKIPTLILWGEADQIIEVAAAQKFKAAIPQAELVIYPNVGHLPQWEIPARSAADVARFLDSSKGE
ncbi:alpha/beta hydrolase [Niveispirillum sp. BGYR6]|uniref:alpha/beta fold hydrolase n=1 Tax=Niveispirillum sp. BGYR6 TaxID=2971249 RepID=UPI0022B9D025|nr:alpha/beta hydrolase [Niveispirillum sp. BGYR6]MDG5496047.1 alpha/beta hydrolase [Niveispirillum sp. BGYR6]